MRMKQVFINLSTNAIQASPPGESIFIRSGNQDGKLVIDINDHGPGIPAEQKEHIFTPFFTTKKERCRFRARYGEKHHCRPWRGCGVR